MIFCVIAIDMFNLWNNLQEFMKWKFSLNEVVSIIDPEGVIGRCCVSISGVAPLNEAKPGDLSFCRSKEYLDDLKNTSASMVLVPGNIKLFPAEGQMFVFCRNPSYSFGLVCAKIEEILCQNPVSGVAETALIHSSVKLGSFLTIGPKVVIEEGVKIADNVVIGAGTFIGCDTEIGENTVLAPNVTVMARSRIGRNVKINSGAVIGSDGFGYEMIGGEHKKVSHIGNVVIEDDVEIGANTTIDRARIASTIIGRGTKIDNLVQIAHNVRLGDGCIVIAQTGIAGSSRLGNYVMLGGQVGIAGHLDIGDGAKICAQSGVTKDVEPESVIIGSPAKKYHDFIRQMAAMKKLPGYIKKVEILGRSLKDG
ncbi:MAG: UDP-3-O-(3-hydroxymyristoyl)glucosamine N-acyltransferase [Puniceicoccales bacterium]|jgi:UDP-3-O-[3-hydroxymyristoyl] glucosamine N-acyltransferase|nr:UDP-3-O-(3-hydroxymyristoyl)glucosamine N-acyltransferase [Puniceicoccales bacterium]